MKIASELQISHRSKSIGLERFYGQIIFEIIQPNYEQGTQNYEIAIKQISI